MPVSDQENWNKYVEANQDPYGKACVDSARESMRILDDEPGDFDVDEVINRGAKVVGGGITGFMAGCIVSMISQCHSRGDEFRRKWNLAWQIGNEGERANESGGVLNPALLGVKESE